MSSCQPIQSSVHPSLWPRGIERALGCDGTGCEFESWQSWTNIISHVHTAQDYLGTLISGIQYRYIWDNTKIVFETRFGAVSP